jgi:uncharacterized protein YegL
MPYSKYLESRNPGLIVFLIDQSGSMQDNYSSGGVLKSKSHGVVNAVNFLMHNIMLMNQNGHTFKDRVYFSVIGYGDKTGTAFQGNLKGKEYVSISEFADSPIRYITEKMNGKDTEFPIWFEPVANGGTPMCHAFVKAQEIISKWIQNHPDSFPPIVFNITDGESTDGNPSTNMKNIKSLHTSDGNVLLYNLHISGNPDAVPVSFPDKLNGHSDEYSIMLFENASLLPPFAIDIGNKEYKMNLTQNSKGFVLNAPYKLLITALNIGSSIVEYNMR